MFRYKLQFLSEGNSYDNNSRLSSGYYPGAAITLAAVINQSNVCSDDNINSSAILFYVVYTGSSVTIMLQKVNKQVQKNLSFIRDYRQKSSKTKKVTYNYRYTDRFHSLIQSSGYRMRYRLNSTGISASVGILPCFINFFCQRSLKLLNFSLYCTCLDSASHGL